jgi:hypothetical protein
MNEAPPVDAVATDEASLALPELVDRLGRRIASALVIAGALIGLAIYWRPGPLRYQAVAAGSQVVRLDTRSGTMIACEADQCGIVLRHGQHLTIRPLVSPPKAAPSPAPAPNAAR